MTSGISSLTSLGAVPATIIILTIVTGHYLYKITKLILSHRNHRLELENQRQIAEKLIERRGTYYSGKEDMWMHVPPPDSQQSPAASHPPAGAQPSRNVIPFHDIRDKSTKTIEK